MSESNEVFAIMERLMAERRLHNLEFDWDEIAARPKPIAALIVGMTILDHELYSGCSQNHLHVYVFTPSPHEIESDSDETTKVIH